MRVLYLSSYCSGSFWLFCSPCISVWILGPTCPFLQKCSWDFDRGCVESIDYFRKHVIFKIFLFTHKLDIPFFLFQSLIFSIFVVFSVQILYTTFVRFFPKYFFDGIMNEIVFLISSFACSLIVHRNMIDFCILILYLATFLSLFINYNSSMCVCLCVSVFPKIFYV